MVSKSQIKLINSLQQKKYRNKLGLFVVEGEKSINEFLNSACILQELYTTDEGVFNVFQEKTTIVTPQDLKKISNLKTPNKALALFAIPEEKPLEEVFTVVLDDVSDPGNLGTIIRLCDWFGVTQLVCSLNTVDCYNPKVVQATMGSLTRIKVVYKNLTNYLQQTELPVYGAVMDGANVGFQKLIKPSILIMGNEANGISNEIEALLSHKITIPRYGTLQATESLNVATATAILLNEFMRG